MKSFSIIISCFFIWSCSNETKILLGTWSNQESGGNQIFLFKKDSTALWFFENEEGIDTLVISYKIDFLKKPARLDLSGFETGPLKDKVLYGIIEMQKKKTFRFDCEPGDNTFKGMEKRPKNFNAHQTQVFKKVRK